jgi:outer membrane autotransporter protein
LAYGGTATGSAQGIQYMGQLNLGYEWKEGQMSLGPFASGQYSYVGINGFTEQGSLAPLTIPSQGESSFSTEIGMAASPRFKIGSLVLAPNLSAAWKYQFQGYQDNLTAGLASGANFMVQGPATGQSLAVLDAGVSASFNQALSASLQYEGKLGFSSYDSQSFSGGLSYGF